MTGSGNRFGTLIVWSVGAFVLAATATLSSGTAPGSDDSVPRLPILKYDADGSLVWVVSADEPYDMWGEWLGTGSYFVWSASFHLQGFDADGVSLWEVHRPELVDSILLSDQTISTWSWNIDYSDVWYRHLVRYDEAGNVVWSHDLGTWDEFFAPAELVKANEEEFYLVWNDQQRIEKYNRDGQRLWDSGPLAVGLRDYVLSGGADAAGNVYVHGWREDQSTVIMKYTGDGDLGWMFFGEDPQMGAVWRLRAGSEDAVWVFGLTKSDTPGWVFFLSVLDADGVLAHANWAVVNDFEYPVEIGLDRFGNAFLVGSTDTYSPGGEIEHAYVIVSKYDAEAKEMWTAEYHPTAPPWLPDTYLFHVNLWSAAVDSEGDVYFHATSHWSEEKTPTWERLAYITGKFSGDGELVWVREYRPSDGEPTPDPPDPGAEEFVYVAGGNGLVLTDQWEFPPDADDDDDNNDDEADNDDDNDDDNDPGCGC